MKRPIIISWDPKFTVGNPALDEEHKTLLALINNVYVSAQSMNVDDVESRLSILIAFSLTHFHHEESYMRKMLFPEIADHKRLHDEFLIKVQNFHTSFQKGKNAGTTSEMSTFLASWWRDHILHEDQKYAVG